MNITDALKETGRAAYPMWNKGDFIQIISSAFVDDNNEPYYTTLLLQDGWEPYREVEEIRPEKAGELWTSDKGAVCFTVESKEFARLQFIPQFPMVSGDEKVHTQIIPSDITHNKNGWTREFPKVED